MNIKVVGYVLAVAQTKNFHNAASICGVSQPALSTAVKSFEDYLGISIFIRTTRRVGLTAAGEKIISQLKVISGEIDALKDLANYHKETNVAPLKIAAEDSLASFIMPLIPKIKARLPEVDLRLSTENNNAAISKLMNGMLDLAILPSDDCEPSGLIGQIISVEPLLLIAHENNELSKKTMVNISDLLSEKFVLPHAGSLYSSYIRESLGASFDVISSNSYTTKTIDGICMMVHAGMGLGFVPASCLKGLQAYNLRVLKTVSPIEMSLKLFWRANEERTHSVGHIRRILMSAHVSQI